MSSKQTQKTQKPNLNFIPAGTLTEEQKQTLALMAIGNPNTLPQQLQRYGFTGVPTFVECDDASIVSPAGGVVCFSKQNAKIASTALNELYGTRRPIRVVHVTALTTSEKATFRGVNDNPDLLVEIGNLNTLKPVKIEEAQNGGQIRYQTLQEQIAALVQQQYQADGFSQVTGKAVSPLANLTKGPARKVTIFTERHPMAWFQNGMGVTENDIVAVDANDGTLAAITNGLEQKDEKVFYGIGSQAFTRNASALPESIEYKGKTHTLAKDGTYPGLVFVINVEMAPCQKYSTDEVTICLSSEAYVGVNIELTGERISQAFLAAQSQFEQYLTNFLRWLAISQVRLDNSVLQRIGFDGIQLQKMVQQREKTGYTFLRDATWAAVDVSFFIVEDDELKTADATAQIPSHLMQQVTAILAQQREINA